MLSSENVKCADNQQARKVDVPVFAEVIELINEGIHLRKKEFKKIVELAFQLPRPRRKYSKEFLLSSLRDYTPDPDIPSGKI